MMQFPFQTPYAPNAGCDDDKYASCRAVQEEENQRDQRVSCIQSNIHMNDRVTAVMLQKI